MTHEELLEKLIKQSRMIYANQTELIGWFNAIRAVVEMHKPNEITWAVKEPFIACYSCAEEYPCPTIETIIEELK